MRSRTIPGAENPFVTASHSAIPIPTRRQALEQARRSPGFKGICRHCGCTENNACILDDFIGTTTCGWYNREQTCCKNPKCITKEKESK